MKQIAVILSLTFAVASNVYCQSEIVFKALPSGSDVVEANTTVVLNLANLKLNVKYDIRLWDGELGKWSEIGHILPGMNRVVWSVGSISGTMFRLFVFDCESQSIAQSSPAYFRISYRESRTFDSEFVGFAGCEVEKCYSIPELDMILHNNIDVVQISVFDMQGKLLHHSNSSAGILGLLSTKFHYSPIFIHVITRRDGVLVEERFIVSQ